MNPASVDIKDMLEADSTLGLEFGTNLFIGREPATTNESITIFDTPGRPPMLTFAQGENYFYSNFQIRVRGVDYEIAWATCLDILKSLHGRAETINDTLYTVITCLSGPAMLEWDDNNRVKFVINFESQRREA
jgi:hypothetical protein